MLDALARAIARRPRRILAATAIAAAVCGVLGAPVPGLLVDSTTSFEDPSSAGVQARHLFERSSGLDSAPDVILLVRDATPARIARARALLAADPSVAVVSPAVRSVDRRSAFVAGTFAAGRGDAARLAAAAERIPGVIPGGGAVAADQVGDTVRADLTRAELYAFPILLVLSLLVFRGLVAALLPPLVGGATIAGTFAAMRAVNAALPLSVFAVNLVTGLGLGLAIDYSLFVLSRYREELARSGPGPEALRRTLTTAGRTVLFSGLTVSAALGSLCLFPLRFLYSMGLSGAIGALVAVVVSLVGLGALLAVLGPRVDALAPGFLRRAAARTALPAERGFWYRLSRGVMRRPLAVALASAAVLVACGVPFLHVRFTGVDATSLPASASSRQVQEALQGEFPPTPTAPVYVVLRAPASAGAALRSYAERLRALPGAAEVVGPTRAGPGVWRVDVVAEGRVLSASAKDLVRAVRAAPAPYPALVGGVTAGFLDQQASLASHLPEAVGALVATTLVLLFLATGSVLLPLKSLVMNLLSLGAAFGLLVLVFQDGRLESVFRYSSQGALESTQPVLLFVVAFALATDYGLFLLTRIKEHHDAGLPNGRAVPLGLERTGRIVTSAALLFCVAIGAFSTSRIVFVKELGVGTAIAVLVDATIVRALLVPSLMALLGEWNWWAPRPLRRLQQRLALR
ncbi:MAG TPA: MMPL family transporter [Gaiellaceae bacterium]|nr:MMPL family transporter [Gaiellaceae bacterium]